MVADPQFKKQDKTRFPALNQLFGLRKKVKDASRLLVEANRNSSTLSEDAAVLSPVEFDRTLDRSEIIERLVDRALEGQPGALRELRSIAQDSEDLEGLIKLKDIDPQRFVLEDASDLAACLTLIGMFDEAELALNRKAGSLPVGISGADLLPFLEAYGLVRAEQGKFGRKPVDPMPLWNFFDANLSSLRRDPRFSAVLPHIIAHLSHFRMVKELQRFSEDLVAGTDKDDIPSLVKYAQLVVSSIMAPSKRPDLHVHSKHLVGRELYRHVEAEASAFYHGNGRDLPKTVLINLFQMALAVDDLAKIDRYKSAVFGNDKPPQKGELANFKKAVSDYFTYLARATRYKDARIFLASQKAKLPEEFYLHLVSSCYLYERNYAAALSVSETLLRNYKKNSYRRKIATVYANSGELEKADEWLREAARVANDSGASRNEIATIRNDHARVEFLLQSSKILESVAQPILPKGVVFLGSSGCLNTISMTVPVLVELKRRGYAVIQLDEGMLRNQPTGTSWIDKHAGAVDKVIHSDFNILNGLQNEWVIDWPRKKVMSGGINFYQGIFEIMTQRLRAFNFDISDPGVYRWFRHYLVRSDRSLSACKAIERDVMSRGVPVRFMNAGSHSAPFSVYRTFALHYASKYDVGFVHMGPAYENYYSNLKSKVATTVSLDNLTKYPLYRLPFLARPDRFEEWLQQDGLYDRYKEDIDRVLNHNRVGRIDGNTSHTQYEDVLIRAKQDGRRVIGVYGKILCDMAVPFDGGPGHENIVDWLRHTVSTARSTSNLIVLKPHPHELRPEIARDLNEYWLDLIAKMDIPENVMVLPHTGFNNQDLIKYLDLAVLWNGTSSLELCAQGVSVVMASYFGKHDYPIDLIYPESRSDYERIICAHEWERPDQSKMERAALLLKYMGTEEVCVPFKYSHRPVTNDPVGVPYWHMDDVERFLRDGDPHISKLVDKVFA